MAERTEWRARPSPKIVNQQILLFRNNLIIEQLILSNFLFRNRIFFWHVWFGRMPKVESAIYIILCPRPIHQEQFRVNFSFRPFGSVFVSLSFVEIYRYICILYMYIVFIYTCADGRLAPFSIR